MYRIFNLYLILLPVCNLPFTSSLSFFSYLQYCVSNMYAFVCVRLSYLFQFYVILLKKKRISSYIAILMTTYPLKSWSLYFDFGLLFSWSGVCLSYCHCLLLCKNDKAFSVSLMYSLVSPFSLLFNVFLLSHLPSQVIPRIICVCVPLTKRL